MRPKEMLEAMAVAARLKENTRHCWIKENRKESVADHTFRIALMAMLLEQEPEFRDVDINKVIKMCLIHDLGEAFTGDIPTFEKSAADENREENLLAKWIHSFGAADAAVFGHLLLEMEALQTKEAKIYKALDKIEAVISHNESDIASWLPLEYDLQKTYGQENMQCSGYFVELRKLVDEWTERKIQEEKDKNE